MELRDNLFSGTLDYHVKLAEDVTRDLLLEGGALEVPAGKSLGDLLFDGNDEPGLGRVILK